MSGRAFSLVLAATMVLACEQTGPEREISGQRIYEHYCARCHGTDGRAVPEQPGAKDLRDRQVMDRLSDESIKMIVRRGKPKVMPAFNDEFTDASLMVLVAYVRSLSGSQGKHAQPESPDDAPSDSATQP